jgi:hypothetical protein
MSKLTVWVPHPEMAWVTAKVLSSDKTSVTVKTDDSNETLKVPGDVSNSLLPVFLHVWGGCEAGSSRHWG